MKFEQLPEDGGIKPDSGNERLQDNGCELSDDTSQFTTKTIDDPKDHDISDNLADRPNDEEPSSAIAEGGQDAVQIDVTVVENPVSDPIYKNALSLLEM